MKFAHVFPAPLLLAAALCGACTRVPVGGHSGGAGGAGGTGGDGGNSPPDSSAGDAEAPVSCGRLESMPTSASNIAVPITVEGADGFAALRGALDFNRLSTMEAGTLDRSGTFTPRAQLEKLWAGENVFFKAAARGSTWAALVLDTYGANTFRIIDTVLFFSDRPARSVQHTSAVAGPVMRSFALGPGGNPVIAEQGPSDTSVHIKKFDAAGALLAETTLASAQLHVSDVELDEQGRTIVVLAPENVSSTCTGCPMPPPGRVIVLDAALSLLGSWTAPVDVVAPAAALDGQGHVLLGGRQIVLEGTVGNETSPRSWLHAIDVSTRQPAWPAPIVGGDGQAAAIDVAANGDILVAGHFTSPWLERYTANRGSRWSRRAEAAPVGFPVRTSGVAEQSDGSIFVSSSAYGYLFVANADPTTCGGS